MPMHCHGGVMMLTAWRCLCWRYWRRHNIQTIKANYRGEPGLADEARDHSPDAERHENSAPSVVTPRCRIKHSLWLLGHTSHKSRAWIRRIPLKSNALSDIRLCTLLKDYPSYLRLPFLPQYIQDCQRILENVCKYLQYLDLRQI